MSNPEEPLAPSLAVPAQRTRSASGVSAAGTAGSGGNDGRGTMTAAKRASVWKSVAKKALGKKTGTEDAWRNLSAEVAAAKRAEPPATLLPRPGEACDFVFEQLPNVLYCRSTSPGVTSVASHAEEM
jgi:hypothetical protein